MPASGVVPRVSSDPLWSGRLVRGSSLLIPGWMPESPGARGIPRSRNDMLIADPATPCTPRTPPGWNRPAGGVAAQRGRTARSPPDTTTRRPRRPRRNRPTHRRDRRNRTVDPDHDPRPGPGPRRVHPCPMPVAEPMIGPGDPVTHPLLQRFVDPSLAPAARAAMISRGRPDAPTAHGRRGDIKEYSPLN